MGNLREQPQNDTYELPPTEPRTGEITPDKENDENKSRIGDSIKDADSFLDEMDKKNHKKDKEIERKYQS